MIEKIKELRLEVDMLIQYAYTIKSTKIVSETSVTPVPYIEEATLAYRSLQMAKGWLGKVLNYLGKETPYAVVSEVKDIPPTAEVYDKPFDIPSDTLIQLNDIREKIESEVEYVNFLESAYIANAFTGEVDGEVVQCVRLAWQHLSEAKMWYGFCLGILRDQK